MELQSQVESLKASIARLNAETTGTPEIDYAAAGIDEATGLAAAETALFEARKNKLAEMTRAIHQEMTKAEQERNVLEPLVEQQVVGRIELIRLDKEIASHQGRLVEITTAFRQEAYTELSQKKAELATLEQSQLQRQDQLRRTDIVAGIRGRVNTILINTPGGIIQPGEALMEISPIDEPLLIEAKIEPRDVAFIAPGMPVRVKITAYDYTIYGDLQGRLEQISADTIEETPRGVATFYRILISTSSNHLVRNGEILPIRPGMIAEVDVLSGKRTILSYLLRPLLKASLR